MFFGKGIKIGRIFGIDIELDFSWFIIFGILIFWYVSFYSFYEADFFVFKILVAAFTAILLFASVLFHELSHSLVAKLHGISVSKITLLIFGGVAQTQKDFDFPGQEFRVAIAGPIASVLAGIIFGIVAFLIGDLDFGNLKFEQVWESPFLHLAFVNFFLAVFNLMPAFPLDGGRIFKSILWWRWRDAKKALRASSIIGKNFGVIMIVLGILILFFGGGLINGLWLAFMGFIIKRMAEGSWLGYLYSTIKVGDMIDFVKSDPRLSALSGGWTQEIIRCSLDDSLQKCVEVVSGAKMPYVEVEENGRLIGFLFKEDIWGFVQKNKI